MTFWKKRGCPKWAAQRILSLYDQSIHRVERLREAVNMQYAASGCKEPNGKLLRMYSYAVGEAAAIEAVMDRLFIQYDDKGKLKELYL